MRRTRLIILPAPQSTSCSLISICRAGWMAPLLLGARENCSLIFRLFTPRPAQLCSGRRFACRARSCCPSPMSPPFWELCSSPPCAPRQPPCQPDPDCYLESLFGQSSAGEELFEPVDMILPVDDVFFTRQSAE